MRRLQRSIFVVVIGVGAFARAQGLDTARIALDSAERRMSGASIDAINARRELDFALTNQHQAANAARNAATTLDQIRLVLDDPAMVDRAMAEARGAAVLVGERELALRQVRERLDVVARSVEETRTQARANFERGAVYTQAVERRDQAQDRLADVEALNLWQLEGDPEYQRLVLAAEFTRSRVQQLRDAATLDQPALSRASQFWIDTESELGTYEQWWLQSDPAVIAARQALSDARQGVAEVERRFEAQLAEDPRIVELIAMRDAEQRAVTEAAAEMEEARALERAAQANAATMRDRLVMARNQYDQLLAELSASRMALDQAATSVWHADRSYRDVLDRHDRAQIDRDRAFRDYRRAQADRDSLRDEQDRIVRDQIIDTNPSNATANRRIDREARSQAFEDDRRPPTVTPPLVQSRDPQPAGGSAPLSREPVVRPAPDSPIIVTPRTESPRAVDSPRVVESPRDTSGQLDRIDNAIRRSTDDAAGRSPGTYRPAAGSTR